MQSAYFYENEEEAQQEVLEQKEKINNFNKIKDQAIEYMKLFFSNKKYWAGGSISKSRLLSEVNVMTVINVNVMDAFGVAYECLAEQKPVNFSTEINSWDIKLCYPIMKECESLKIPKCYAGGILLVYLNLCQGISYVDVLKKYNLFLQNINI